MENPSRIFVREEVELRGRPASEISHWWRTLTVTSYLIISGSGIALSISTGDILAAFENNCILYSKITLKDLDKLGDNKTLGLDNFLPPDKWNGINDCYLCEYGAASSVLFSGILFVLFLQCGKGGLTERSQSRSWEIVPLALPVNFIFFIISTVVLAKTIGGLGFFCTYILQHSKPFPEGVMWCGDILSYRFPMDQYNTDLYLEYVVSQVAAVLLFIGWFMVLAIQLLRVLLGIDFVVYRRQQFADEFEETKPKRKIYYKKQSKIRMKDPLELKGFYGDLSSSSSDTESSEETTFILKSNDTNKLNRRKTYVH